MKWTKIKIWLAKFFYPVAIWYWPKWSKIYRWLWQREYKDIKLDENLSPVQANEKVRKLTWRADGAWALGDACGSPHWVQYALNKVVAGLPQPKGYLDCDDFSSWCVDVVDRKHDPRIFTFSWMSKDGKLAGHAMCLVRQKDGRVYHIGNWGLYGPYMNLREACSVILTKKGSNEPIGWSLFNKDLKKLQCGRGLPLKVVI
jgi:hypothetical protein